MKNTNAKNIYLAGKIQTYAHDWRNTILNKSYGSRCPEWTGTDDHDHVDSVLEIQNWEINYGIVLNHHNYTGPYFIACDHQCFHGTNSHGVGVITGGEIRDCETHHDENHNETYSSIHEENFKMRGIKTVELCQRSIELSDIIFVWIDDNTCYGTLAEIGYAKAKNKIILIASPKKNYDLWFVYSMADSCVFDFDNPKDALSYFLSSDKEFNS